MHLFVCKITAFCLFWLVLLQQEYCDEESKDDSKTDKVIPAKMDDSKTGAMPCQKSGIDHFNYAEANPKNSNAMSKHLFLLIFFSYLNVVYLML